MRHDHIHFHGELVYSMRYDILLVNVPYWENIHPRELLDDIPRQTENETWNVNS